MIDPTRLRFTFNRMPADDARDWTAIRAWANKLAALLQTKKQDARAASMMREQDDGHLCSTPF